MCEHLTQQKDSLAQLDLDLGGLFGIEDYETQSWVFHLAHLKRLTDLTIKNRFPDDLENGRMLLDQLPRFLQRLSICDFPYATDGEAMVVAAQHYLPKDLSTDIGFQEAAKESALDGRGKQNSKLLPNLQEFSVAFTDKHDPGAISERLRRCFEYIGKRYRNELGWHFIVNRITEMRGAVPPYLWDEHVVDFVKVYDNTVDQNLWNTKSDHEIVEERERERLAEAERRARAVQEERERIEAEEATRLGLSESVSPPSPPPAISPVKGSLSQSVATASPGNIAVVAAAMAMANTNVNAVLGEISS